MSNEGNNIISVLTHKDTMAVVYMSEGKQHMDYMNKASYDQFMANTNQPTPTTDAELHESVKAYMDFEAMAAYYEACNQDYITYRAIEQDFINNHYYKY